MSRQAKLKFAAVLTAVVTSLGTVAVGATAGTIDAGKSNQKTNNSWCC